MTYHPCSTETSRKSGALTYPEPLGSPRPVAGDLYFYYYYYYYYYFLTYLITYILTYLLT